VLNYAQIGKAKSWYRKQQAIMPAMDKKWCCQEFESHATVIPSEDGFRAVLVWGKTHFLSLLEFRSSNKHALDSSESGMKIWFCPWCGRSLEQHYSSIKVQISG
jgi:hypothetical protein